MEIQIVDVYSQNSENESGSSEALAPAVERVPGPRAVRRALLALRPPEGSIIVSSDDEEDEVVFLCSILAVPESQQRLVPEADDPMPGSSQPDTSVPLRTANCLNEGGETESHNLDLSSPDVLRKLLEQYATKLMSELNANKRLRNELEDGKVKIENQNEELEALKTNLDQCRRELRKEQEEIKILKEQLKKKKVECLKSARKRTTKKTPASKSRATAVAGSSRKAPVAAKSQGSSVNEKSKDKVEDCETPKQKSVRFALPKEKDVLPPPAKMRNEKVVVEGDKKQHGLDTTSSKGKIKAGKAEQPEQVSPKLFACENCERVFDSERGLVSHSSKAHKNPKQKPGAGGNKYATRSLSGTDEVARRTRSARNQK